MCSNDDPDYCHDVPDEQPVAAPEPAAETERPLSLRRRTFLKAAALGGAAAALRTSMSVQAHTDTTSPCTAGDISLTGGQIVNEPCSCSSGGTFDAVAQFTVRNDNNSRRLNITLHMGTCSTFGGKDFLLRTGSDGKSGSCSINGLGTTKTMYAFLGSLPCDFSSVCCPGSVIAFQTAKNQQDVENCSQPLTKYPGGQCRRQEICIVGFDAILTCGGSCDGATSDNCSVGCGQDLVLRATAVGGTQGSNGTYTFTVTDPDGNVVGSAGPGASSPQCFTISSPKSGTYTLTVTDSQGCTRTDTIGVSVTALTPPVLSAGAPDCDGNVTYTVDNCDATLTYTFSEVDCSTGAVIGSALGTGCSLTQQWPADSTHCVKVTASNGDAACDVDSNTVTSVIPPAVTVVLGAPQSDCSGVVILTATAAGGVGPYTFRWSVDGNQQSETGDTLTLQPQLDGTCRVVRVRAIDSRGCESASTAVQSFSQCVVTTAC